MLRPTSRNNHYHLRVVLIRKENDRFTIRIGNRGLAELTLAELEALQEVIRETIADETATR